MLTRLVAAAGVLAGGATGVRALRLRRMHRPAGNDDDSLELDMDHGILPDEDGYGSDGGYGTMAVDDGSYRGPDLGQLSGRWGGGSHSSSS